MARKAFVLDTNVLLHDPDALLKFKNNDVVMPLFVLEELDKMKRFTDELGKNARHVIRFIDSLKGDLFRGVKLENEIQFSIYIENKLVDEEGLLRSLDNNKHRILFAAYKLQLEGREGVVLISKDFVLRIKAEFIGIQAQNYESLKESYDNLYRGLKKHELTKLQIDGFSTKGFIELQDLQGFPNEYCRFTSPEKSTAIGKFNKEKNRFETIPPFSGDIWGIRPLNDEQQCAIDLLLNDDIHLVTLIGQAGTGKTLLALTCGLRKVFDESVYNSPYAKEVICCKFLSSSNAI